jgi:hypothetical protein
MLMVPSLAAGVCSVAAVVAAPYGYVPFLGI